MKIQIFGLGRKWYYHFVAGNGEIVHPSEQYVSKQNAKRAAKKFVKTVREQDITIEVKP